MGFFRKRVNEDELERAILFAGMLAAASERDSGKMESSDGLHSSVDYAFSKMKLKPTHEQRETAFICVNALLTEHNFINELINYRLQNRTNKLPPNARSRMMAVIKTTAEEFESSQPTEMSGESFEEAIVISKLPAPLAVQTEYAHITSKHGIPGEDWELELQELIEAQGEMYDVLTIIVSGKINKTYYFNVTQCMGK